LDNIFSYDTLGLGLLIAFPFTFDQSTFSISFSNCRPRSPGAMNMTYLRLCKLNTRLGESIGELIGIGARVDEEEFVEKGVRQEGASLWRGRLGN
jgi:hypothetical protein